ncbi:beta/gamma crystallin-related protein [Brevundimonas lenta]|uniref:Beta/gamma crystallin 'Greek key' domain-containing protein n=1 Tax=Brevundimonas lenta TaxID=424796 RepID=A0A7W6JE79_9CAUL|nr:beta/gamma crystallin-related protein [Brevundimonas lenta]MBB4083504.1 hypothetical protein [Brevundimonas lenta]
MFIETLAALAVMSGGGQEAAPYGGGQERVAPRGDYRQSCSGEYVNRGRLYADCQTRRGRVQGTSIQLNRCTEHEIRNNDGVLVCGPYRGQVENSGGGGGGGGGNGGGWGGGRNSIVVYRDANFQGASMSFDGEVANLANTGFNDTISSMRFRGSWEVCTDAYFRGSCRVFNDEVTNLRPWGINDRVSSMRPVRGSRGW